MTDSSRRRVAALSLGANLGDRFGTLQSAIGMLARTPGVDLMKASAFFLTEPVGVADQPEFVNCCVTVETTLSPEDLHDATRQIEDGLGRATRERWREREIDIDLLLMGSLVIRSTDLVVPHPEMHRRRFVLEPLAEIAPEMVHPVRGLTVQELLDLCSDPAAVHRAEGGPDLSLLR